MDERGSVLASQRVDVVRQSVFERGPALVSVVDDVETRVSVVQLQPLDAFWQFEGRWKHRQTLADSVSEALCYRLRDSVFT